MTLDPKARQAVDREDIAAVFRAMGDSSNSSHKINAMRAERLQGFLNELSNSAAGSNLKDWEENIQARMRSGAPLDQIVAQLVRLQHIGHEMEEIGADATRRANGYAPPEKPVETIADTVLVRPDVTPSADDPDPKKKKHLAGNVSV